MLAEILSGALELRLVVHWAERLLRPGRSRPPLTVTAPPVDDSLFSISCTTCLARLGVRNESAIGAIGESQRSERQCLACTDIFSGYRAGTGETKRLSAD